MAEHDVLVLREAGDGSIEVPQPGDSYNFPAPANFEGDLTAGPEADVFGLNLSKLNQLSLLIDISEPIDLDSINFASADSDAALRAKTVYTFNPTLSSVFPVNGYINQGRISTGSGVVAGRNFYEGDWVFNLDLNIDTSDIDNYLVIHQNPVTSINGKEPESDGNFVLESSDFSGLGFLNSEDIDSLEKLKTISNANLDETSDPRPPTAHTHELKEITHRYEYKKNSSSTNTLYSQNNVSCLDGFVDASPSGLTLDLSTPANFTVSSQLLGSYYQAFIVVNDANSNGSNIVIKVTGNKVDPENFDVTVGFEEIFYDGPPGNIAVNQGFISDSFFSGDLVFSVETDGTSANATLNFGVLKNPLREKSISTLKLSEFYMTGQLSTFPEIAFPTEPLNKNIEILLLNMNFVNYSASNFNLLDSGIVILDFANEMHKRLGDVSETVALTDFDISAVGDGVEIEIDDPNRLMVFVRIKDNGANSFIDNVEVKYLGEVTYEQ